MLRKTGIGLLALVLCFIIFGCDKQKEIKRSGFYLDTIFDVQVNVDNKKEIIARETRNLNNAFDRLVELDANINKLSPLSEISALNSHASVRPVEASKLTYSLLEKSLYASAFTDGYFDVSWYPLIKIFEAAKPSAERIARARAAVGHNNISLESNLRRVRYLNNNTEVDFSLIKAGFAIDLLVSNLKNITAGQIKAGNVAYYYGPKRVVFKVTDKQNIVLKPNNSAIAALDTTTSYYSKSVAWRSYLPLEMPEEENVQIRQVIVIAPNAVTAEVLANAFYFMGVEKSLQKIAEIKKQASRQNTYELYFILAEENGLRVVSSAD